MDQLKPRERRQQRTRQAILDAARRIISKKGPNALSMRAIAKAIDYSPAGLYEYFGSKEEIIEEVCKEGDRRFFAYMDAVSKQLPVEEYLVQLGQAYIRFALQNPDYFLLMFTTRQSEVDPEKARNDDSSFGLLLAAIARGIDEGIYKPYPGFEMMEMAYAAWTQVHGMAMLRITNLRNFPMDFDAIDREVLRNLACGLAMSKVGNRIG